MKYFGGKSTNVQNILFTVNKYTVPATYPAPRWARDSSQLHAAHVQDCEDGSLRLRARHHFLNDSYYPSILLDAAHCNRTADD